MPLRIESELPEHVEKLVERVVQVVGDVRRELGVGLPERHYHRAMEIALASEGMRFASKPEVPIVFRGERLGSVFPDMLVENNVVLEFKAVETLHAIHEAQALTYLVTSGKPIVLLVNFHAVPLRTGIRRFAR